MHNTKSRSIIGFAVLSAALMPNSAWAIPWARIAVTLNDFDTGLSVRRNAISQGYDVTLSNSYNERRFDFGLSDLTLTGASTTQINLSKRLLPSIDLRSSTQGAPMAYDFNINTGLQDINATGRVSWDNKASINALGFYDLKIDISNRGTFKTNGYADVDSGTTDTDLGPINISGNVFIDLLAVITEPLYQAANQPNPFSKISGRAARSAIDQLATDAIRAKIANGELLTDDEIDSVISASLLASILGEEIPGLDLSAAQLQGLTATDGAQNQVARTVPEPITLVLLAGPLLLIRRARRS